MKPRKPQMIDLGPAVQHDQCCAVFRAESAVYDLNRGVFLPSWKAQSEGWHLVHASSWLQRLALRLVMGKEGGQ